MKKSLLTTAMVALAMPVFAIPNPIPSANELPEFDMFDEVIQVPSYQDRVIYKFTPETAGVLTVYEKANDAYLFVGRTYSQEDYTIIGLWYGSGPVETILDGYDYGFYYEMSPDQQYYIALPLESYCQAKQVYITWEEIEVGDVAITDVFPEPTLEPYDYNMYQEIIVTADQSITSFDKVFFSYLEEEMELPKGSYVGLNGPNDHRILQIKISAIGMTNYAEIAAKAGADNFSIKITGLLAQGVPVTEKDIENPEVLVDNGTVILNYACEEAPSYMASESIWPETFYSYWSTGNPDGIATLVFDQPILSVGSANVVMAYAEPGAVGGEGEVQSYNITPRIDGNKVILDFTGVVRLSDTSQVTVGVENVIGENGLTATMTPGSVGLYKHISYVATEAPEDPSALESILKENETQVIYNLNGVKLEKNKLIPGVYIINGKKVLVK